MASLNELKKKYLKKNEPDDNNGSNENTSSGGTSKSTLNELRNKYLKPTIDQNGVNDWLKNTYSFVSRLQNSTDSEYKTYTNPETTKEAQALKDNSIEVMKYIRYNKRSINNYDDLYNGYSQLSSALDSVLETNKTYSQFKSEDDFNVAKYYSMSTEELEKYLEEEKQKLLTDEYIENKEFVDYLSNQKFITSNGAKISVWDILNQKKVKDLPNTEDFEYYSNLGANVENPSYAAANGSDNFLGWKNPFKKGEEIKNIVTFSRDNIDEINKRLAMSHSNADMSEVLGDYRYQFLTDEEVSIYNYYIGKGDKEKADEYLEALNGTLDQRWAEDIAGNVSGNKFLEMTFAVNAGLDQFMSGIGNIDNLILGKDPDQTTVTQIAGSMIRDEIDGGWGVTYDLISNLSNMAPSMLVGSLTGGLGGALTMGVSATGNAYAEMRNLGYDEWQSRGYAALVGASEAGLSYLLGGISKLGGKVSGNAVSNLISKFDNAIARTAIQLGGNMASEGLEEAIQTVLEPAFKALVTGEDFEAPEWEDLFYSALLGALSAGVLEGGPTIAGTAINSYQTGAIYGGDMQAMKDLTNESLEIDPTNEHAQRMQSRLDSGKKISGYQINRLTEANETAMRKNDSASIQKAAAERLTTLGETGKIDAIAKALSKQAAGEKLSLSEKNLIKNSKFGQRVANELNPGNINSGEYSSAWAQKIGTDRINAEEYGRLLSELDADDANATTATEPAEITSPDAQVNAQQTETVDLTENPSTEKNAAEGKIEASESVPESDTEGETVTLADASVKYGAQAQAMIHTYAEGQNVAQYDKAYETAYNMGKSGVSLSYALESEATAYLSKNQRKLAYEAGKSAADTTAREQDAANKKAANGKTGRKIGAVKGEGVTIEDLKKTFNDTQNKAYKILSTYAEATGIDIVLYKSEANADGKFEGSQGRFKWSEDTIYIDINAGLADIKNVNDLAKYAMLRTFSHEFTHFIEKWNPIWYNEFRKVVFDTLTERGENVHDLIEQKMALTEGMSYDAASREVVAEAMTDILPDANFVQELAENHKNIFQKILEKLKEFAADLKAYFNSIGHNRSREANALKEQVGEAIHYVDNIVKLFDKVALEAVENYQMTVAVDEFVEKPAKIASTESINSENNAEKVTETIKAEESETDTEVTEETTAETETTEEEATPKKAAVTEEAVSKTDNRTIEELDNEYKKNFSRWLKRANRQYAMHYGGTTFLSDGAFGLIASKDMLSRARTEFVGQIYETALPEAAKNALDKSNQLLTEAPLEGTLGEKTVCVFNIDGKKHAFDKKFISRLDGNLLYMGDFTREAKIIKAVDSEGNTIGFLLPVRVNQDITNTKPSKLKSFSSKFLSQINQEVKPNGENANNRGTVQESVSDRQEDSRVLDEVETRDVSGNAPRGDSVGDSVERGRETVRNDVQPDAAGTRGRSGVGDSESGDIRRADGLTSYEAAKSYAEEKGYRIEINKLSAKKNVIQIDIYDKQGLPTFNPIIIGELGKDSDITKWNQVKESIDKRENAEKVKADTAEESSQQVTGKLPASEEESSHAAEKLHTEVTEQIEQQSTEKPKGRNFVIGDSLDLPNGEKARYKANIEAIRLVKQLEAENRYATEAEQTILSKYVGWGGLANAFDERKSEWAKEYKELKDLLTKEEYELARGSTLNAHYTDISVIKAMYDGLRQLGFNGGRVLEPASGVGNFVGAMPTDMSAKVKSFTMVELDGITGLIAKYLYPNADVRIQGFEKANIPNNFMDVAISNVPFGNYPITDKAYPKKVTSAIHNYFFAKSLDKVRPGGILMFITSSYTMNAKDETVRRYIMQKADLLGAIRLPDTAFKGNAGTEVVTDILILKKREAGTTYAGEDFLEAPWTYPVKGNYNGANINSYFAAHPEMVLGTPSMEGGMYRGSSLTYKALEGKGSLADQIREAFKSIKGKMDYTVDKSPEKTNFAVERATKKTKQNGYVAKDGKIYQNKDGQLIEQTVSDKVAERIKGMLEIRDAARDLQNYQQQGLKETEIKKARTKLNKLYDEFVKKNGYINSPANKSAFKDDPDCFSLYALENYNPDTKKATKADIFSKNTIAPNRTVTSAKDVSDGLIVSVNQTGGVDVSLIAKLTGKTEADVTRELIDSRKAFKNRNGELETAETYLSGNVRAKLRDAEALVPMDKDFEKNVEALKAVVPEDVPYGEIFVNPGTPWIPNSVYSDFAAYMLGTVNREWRQAIDITRNADTGNFTVDLKEHYLKNNAANTQKWGTSRRTFLELFDAMLNSKSVVVKDKLDDGSYVINKDATAAANEKIENIQKEFSEWLWKDEARREELATLYNETFNSIVTPKYNGDNLTVNGANAMKPLRPHQRNAVQRVISSGGNTLLAHKVGAGKTYEMAAAAMKLKQLGLVRKPMFAVPKSLVAQWGNEFIDFFPTAKLLVAEASDFTAANRKTFMNRIANGDYDAVIVSYEQFEKLPMSDDFTRELYQEQIDSIVAAIEEAKAEKGAKAMSVKDLEKKRKSLQAKIDKLTDKAKDEDNIDFEQLGVDSLFIDEAHNFKNLFYTTSMTNVSGLGNKDGSKRAFDLYTKVRYLQKLNGGRGIVFATATPVMNSMSEMYIMQKYLQPDLLQQLGLSTFDAWAKQFGEVVNGVEIKPSGQGYRVKQSFSRFKNMSELQLLFRNFADVLTDIPGLKIPKMKGGKVNVVVCEPGQFQQDFMKELEKRADNIKNVDPSVDNMLKITSDGRKISYTQRMIEPTLPYEEGCKIYRCADNVIKGYNNSKDIKGTQLIFCDMATPKGKSKTDTTTETDDASMDMESAKLYDDIRARLIEGGIPRKEIAFIHEADTDQKKKKLFADVNDGKVRVLIGSTGKMGVGMNAQKRVVAIHHLDAPWRPGDVEQRNGRAFRQGNINEEVECFTYVTEGSFDARLWDILERKQNFINQVMNGESVGREAEDTGEVTLSAAEVKALASGSPLIMEQVQLDTDIKKLESLYRAHRSAVVNAKDRLIKDKGHIASLEKQIDNGTSDMLATRDTYSEGKFSITIGKQTFTEKKDAGTALMAAAISKAKETEWTTVGSFAGFEVRVVKSAEGVKGLISGKQGYSFNTYPNNTTFMINHMISVVESITERVNMWKAELAETEKDMAEQEKLIGEPFAKQAELEAKRARYTEVMEILNPKEEQQLDGGAEEDTIQEQSREYLDGDYYAENNKPSSAIGSNFKLSAREYSIREIIEIFKKANNNPELNELFDKVYDFCRDAGVTFFVESSVTDKNGKQRPAVARGNAITYNQGYFNSVNVPTERKATTILHEMLHTATVYAMKAYDNAMQGGALEKLPKNILSSCKEIYIVYAAISKNARFAGDYGAKNAYEMVAKLSDPVFAEKLKGTYPSVWHKLLEVICELFGIKKTFTNYDKLTKAVDEILSHPDYALANKYDSLVNKNPFYLEDSQYTDLNDVQNQQRTDTLTDREVLAMAAEEIKVSDLTESESDALQIFKDRLSKLNLLEEQRAEQGRLYKEQQFGVKPNRAEAEKTLNRMHVLDDQIKKATSDMLSVEDKEVLKRVLKKARRVVEIKEREHGQEILNRWRDRRNNAAAIKKYRDRLRGDVDELTNWIIGPKNKDVVKHVPDVLKNSVIPFLSSINFMSKRSLKGGNATVSDKEFIKRLNALKSAIKTNIDVSGMYSGYNDLPPNFMENLQRFIDTAQALVDKSAGEFIINQMTSDELRDLSKIVRTLKKYIMQVNRFHNNAMYQHVYEAGDNSIEFLKELDNAGSRTGAVSNFVLWQQIRPAYAFERFGKGGEAIYDGLRQGQAKLAFNTEEIKRFTEKAYTAKEVKAWEEEIKTFSLGRDIVKMPVSYIMSFYELSKDPEAKAHIDGEGIRVATYTHKGKKISDTGHILTVGEFNQIIGSLTDRQREVADSLQKYMATQGGKWGNYVSVARFGEELFTNPKYFPINSDGRHLSSTVEEHPSAAALYALLNMSFTKSRKEGANNRIVIYSIFDVFANHMASMAQYNAMALPVLDALKWFNYQQVFVDDEGNKTVLASVREQMTRAYGVPEETRPGSGKQGYAETFIVNIIKAFNGTEAQGTPYDSLGLKSMRRYNMAQVAYNLRVVVQQPLAITRAGMLLDYRSIIKGMKLSPSKIKQNVEEMQKYSGIAAWKALGFYDVNISRGLAHIIKHDSRALDKIGDVGMWGAEKADLLTWAGIWSAAKEEVTKKQHLTPESDGFYEAVTKLFDDIIYKTQVVDSILTKNEFMRDKGTFARLVGSFMSEPTTNASMLIDAYDKYRLDIQRGMSRRDAWQKNSKMIGRRLYVYGVGAVLLAAVQAAADALRDDDEYEEYGEKWLEAFIGNFIDELMPFNKLPILSDFYDLAKELLSIFGVDTYGNPPQSVFMQWYDSLIKGVEIISDKIMNEDTNYTWYGGIYKLLQAASGITGLPMASAMREIITAWNNTVGAFAPSLKLKTYESSELSEIRYAYEDGYLTYDEAVDLLLEKGLADNANEAYFIIQGWEAGEGYSRYDAIFDAVRNGGDFDSAMDELTSHGYTEEEVISKVKSKVGEWYRSGEISKQQAINMLTKYTDMTNEEITSIVNKWSSKVVTGIDYEDIDDEFSEGKITASRAVEMYMLYGGMTREKATEKVTVLEFVKENPETEGISYSAVAAYKQHCEPYGVPVETYYNALKHKNTLSGEVKESMLSYINSLSLSARQKDSLYLAFGWAESKLYEAPWH